MKYYHLKSKHFSPYVLISLILLGIFLILKTKNQAFESLQLNSPSFFAQILGIMLLVGPFAYWLTNDRVSMRFDIDKKRIFIRKSDYFKNERSSINFEDVASIDIKKVGRSHKGVEFYFLIFNFKNQSSLNPNYFSTRFEEVLETASYLCELLNCELLREETHTLRLKPANAHFIWMIPILSVFIYSLWYRLQIGPWCTAMWFGTAPWFIMGSVTFMGFRIFRLSRKQF